eukprot:scaffold2058_cov115-Isochrysis_galbana.AAC.21
MKKVRMRGPWGVQVAVFWSWCTCSGTGWAWRKAWHADGVGRGVGWRIRVVVELRIEKASEGKRAGSRQVASSDPTP